MYLGSNISSIKSDIKMYLPKVRIAIDRLLIIWKSDLSDKIKYNFFQAVIVSILLYAYREKARQELQKNATSYIEATSHKIVALWPPTTHLLNQPNKTDKTCGILFKKQG